MNKPVIAYRRSLAFSESAGDVWAALEDLDGYERWWPWLRDFAVSGGLLRSGARMTGVVAPPLPYRMRIQVDLLRCQPPGVAGTAAPGEIDAIVHGDLEGPAELRVHAEGTGSIVQVAWTMEMMQRPMRIASRLAFPVLRGGHDWVVNSTVAGLRRHLAERPRG